MRIAIFSDVHGNLTALEAVLGHIKRQDPDLVLFAGDLCVFGARPGACAQRVREADIAGVFGNTDSWISNRPLLSDDIIAEKQARSQHVDTAVDWTLAQMDEMDLAWLRTLPFHRRVSPTPHPNDDLFIVHANPQDVDRPIQPAKPLQEKLYGEVKQSDDDLRPLLKGVIAGVISFGHVHIPNTRQWRDLTLANISSVSLPLDGDSRAKYGLLTWAVGRWTIEHKRVEYDVDQEVDYLARLKPPDWQKHIRQLQQATPQ
jgi:predicted phosphodiesterase